MSQGSTFYYKYNQNNTLTLKTSEENDYFQSTEEKEPCVSSAESVIENIENFLSTNVDDAFDTPTITTTTNGCCYVDNTIIETDKINDNDTRVDIITEKNNKTVTQPNKKLTKTFFLCIKGRLIQPDPNTGDKLYVTEFYVSKCVDYLSDVYVHGDVDSFVRAELCIGGYNVQEYNKKLCEPYSNELGLFSEYFRLAGLTHQSMMIKVYTTKYTTNLKLLALGLFETSYEKMARKNEKIFFLNLRGKDTPIAIENGALGFHHHSSRGTIQPCYIDYNNIIKGSNLSFTTYRFNLNLGHCRVIDSIKLGKSSTNRECLVGLYSGPDCLFEKIYFTDTYDVKMTEFSNIDTSRCPYSEIVLSVRVLDIHIPEDDEMNILVDYSEPTGLYNEEDEIRYKGGALRKL